MHGVLQVDMEERFCERVKAMGCTCVTISHRPALVAFHDLVLALDGEGGWTLHRGANAGVGEEGEDEEDDLSGKPIPPAPWDPLISRACETWGMVLCRPCTRHAQICEGVVA